ncbi:uncharacterized protein [Blastocystis hominis]|uniref:Large ribosomal subunit protein eL19 domain-containing protein n=2 Tax=Blastocystis hominis TaxID=12968 RepID=D8M7L3_BLAHO|nr:uncharacterized protein [Blastocystis hominis]CBK24052.2 unnamed protein product [Blastocystis hominis]|eukprot:XP_012898100.1 uncharacterized protein [Blastocystis hominis]
MIVINNGYIRNLRFCWERNVFVCLYLLTENFLGNLNLATISRPFSYYLVELLKTTMVSLKLQKRLAAAVLKCGKRKVWMDPSEVSNIAVANSRQSVRSMIKNGMIVKKHNLMHSRARVNIRHEAKARGNHTGYGKRHGTMNARIPEKLLWMRRIRVLRRLLRKYRDAGKIDKHMYAHFYALAKGNRYKTKRVLIEQIHRKKGEDKKEKQLAEQATALLNQKRAAMEASA